MKICRWVEYGYEKKRGVEHISKILGLSNKKEKMCFPKSVKTVGRASWTVRSRSVLEMLNLRCPIAK